jgi:exonuclease III
LAYNVCGLRNKIRGDFLDFISSFDIVFLQETFLCEKDKDFISKSFSNYRFFFDAGFRIHRFGRCIGGSLLLINLKSQAANFLSFKTIDNFCLVEISLDASGKKVYLLPLYLNFNDWEKEFDELTTFLNKNSFENLVIIGDLNGRVGEQQSFTEDIFSPVNRNVALNRISKDKVTNLKGRKLLDLMENFGLIILNGRFNSDRLGEFTFINTNGESVIDLAVATLNCLKYIRDFQVLNQPGSDHLPIQVNFQLEFGMPGAGVRREKGNIALNLLPKLKWTEGDNRFYREKVSVAIAGVPLSGELQDNVNKITECIVKSAHCKPSSAPKPAQIGKQKWFDRDCLKARKVVFKSLNWFRKNNTDEAKINYLEAARHFKKLCRDKKRTYKMSIISNLSQIKDAKSYWDAIGYFKISNNCSMGNIDSTMWANHFRTLLNPETPDSCIQYAAPYISDDFLDASFTLNELKHVLFNVKSNKAPGIDRIPYEFYKNAPETLLIKVLDIFNNIFAKGTVPESFKTSIVFPLHKKGDINTVENYRGLSFIDCISKIFISLNNRLQTWVNQRNLLTEFQAGFRKGYSTIDNIFNLTCVLNLQLAMKGEKVYSFFVDFSAAFDTINRKALLYKLAGLGLSAKVLNLIENYYKGTKAGVWCKEGVTEFFDTRVGLRQGCSLSPLMFALFVNDLPEALGGGCNLGGIKVNVLLYADDIVILSPSSVDLQIMIRNLEKYCDLWNLKVNLNKSKIVVFRKGGKLRQVDKWWYKNERIEVVNSYKYLGVHFSSTMSWSLHLREKSKISKLAISSVWNKLIDSYQVPINAKFTCFNAVVRAILCYGAEIWGCNEFESVESVLKVFAKRLFRLPKNTPNYVLYLELGIEKLFFQTLFINMRYLLKLSSMPCNRLPKLLWDKIKNKSMVWCKTWKLYGESCGILIDFNSNSDALGGQMMSVIERMRARWYAECVGRARTSQFHQHYLILDLDLGNMSYLEQNLNIDLISWIIKARAGLLSLNFKPWCADSNHLCSLCNLNEVETVFHFTAVCPVLSHFRKKYLGKRSLSQSEFYSFLNGKDWRGLGLFLKQSWFYRWELIQEFNFI